MGQIPDLIITLKSSGDMSSDQYTAVVASSANVSGGCVIATARGGTVTGVWLGDSTAAQFGDVQVSGVARVAAGDSSGMETAITEGLLLVASSVGQAVPSTSTLLAPYGIALGSLSTGSTGVIDMLLRLGTSSTA